MNSGLEEKNIKDLGKYFSTENEISWNKALSKYNKFSLKDLENLVKDIMLTPKEDKPRTIILYTGDEGAANYLRHYFTEEEVQEWLKAPYDLPNIGLRVYEHSSQIK